VLAGLAGSSVRGGPTHGRARTVSSARGCRSRHGASRSWRGLERAGRRRRRSMRRSSMMRSRSETEGWLRDTLKDCDSMDEAYMRIALKAQSQCRMTQETMAQIIVRPWGSHRSNRAWPGITRSTSANNPRRTGWPTLAPRRRPARSGAVARRRASRSSASPPMGSTLVEGPQDPDSTFNAR
jgi:hypothetical protein